MTLSTDILDACEGAGTSCGRNGGTALEGASLVLAAGGASSRAGGGVPFEAYGPDLVEAKIGRAHV